MTPRIRTGPIRRVPFATIAATLALAAAIALAVQPTTVRPPARGGGSEALEQSVTTEGRLDALRLAREDGLFSSTAITTQAAPGWRGAVPMNLRPDDWEPAIAADPNEPYVYWLATRYGVPKPCPGNCPTPFTALKISTDGGKTWGATRPLCACKGHAQYDPIVEVVPDTGHVYALYMNGFNVVFLRSTDHGKTWSAPVKTYGNVSWNDKPALTTSANGRHVYVTWNGPRGGDPWAAVSHDFGRTWSQQRIAENDRYFFAYDGTVLSDGTVILSQSSFDYSGPAASAVGGVEQHLFISTNRGLSWRDVLADTVHLGPPCTTDYCYADFHSGHSGVSSDLDDRLYHVYDGATRHLGPQAVWFRTSSTEGARWADRIRLSAPGVHSTGPTIEATGHGDLRVWYASQDADTKRWETFERHSTDGGLTWSAPVEISDTISGQGYDNANGYLEFYGDYGEIAVTSQGKTVATWGEGFSWLGPGNVWVNVEA